MKLSREEGHVEALEQQLGALDTTRDQLERKLKTVYTSLRTVTRMYQDLGESSPALRGRKGSKLGSYGCLNARRVVAGGGGGVDLFL